MPDVTPVHSVFFVLRVYKSAYAGNTSAKGHIPFIIFALLDVLRSFPGQARRSVSDRA
jgi:hypothetical protein